MNRVASTALVIVGLVLLVGACGDPGESAPTDRAFASTLDASSDLAGDGLPAQQPGEAYGHVSDRLTGTITLEGNGCWTANLGDGPRLVVFPAGYTKPLDDGAIMQSPDGKQMESGMEFDGSGGIVSAQGFPGVPDGWWGNYLAFCAPRLHEFLVLDSIGRAFRPDQLTDEELMVMLERADLSVSWGCGLGFTLSTEDQRVALYVAPLDSDTLVDPPVSFPADRWSGEVWVGKNLMVHHCNDAIEGWKPGPLVVAQWQLTSGSLDFEPPGIDGGCSDGDPVHATLHGVQVGTPVGSVDLGDLDLVNDAYGCFAG